MCIRDRHIDSTAFHTTVSALLPIATLILGIKKTEIYQDQLGKMHSEEISFSALYWSHLNIKDQ